MKLSIFAALIILFSTARPALSWPTVYPTGTTVYVPEQAFNAYTLFTPLDIKPAGNSTVYLINMRGDVVHRWNLPLVVLSVRLLPNGNLIALGANPKQAPGRPGFGKFWIGGAAGTIVESTWDGKEVFRHEDLNMHHDAIRLPNGHYLYLAWEQVPKALQAKVRGGMKGTEFPGGVMFNDYLVEVDGQGKVVWQWHANAHLDPDIDIIGPIYKREEWCHNDSVAVLSNGNILLSSRQTDSMMIVDRKTGKILWRWGTGTYLDKTSGRLEYRSNPNILGGPHNATEIPSGYHGAGNVLCFDNGLYFDGSRAVEVNPTTGKLVWQSGQAQFARRPFSWFLGSAQRLPNGNTLICEGANGRLTQQTAKHELVWEYVNPFTANPTLAGAVLKAHQYAPEYCPQFKKLASAGGAEIVPPTNELLRVQPDGQAPNQQPPAEPQPDLIPLPVALGAVVVLALFLGFLMWKKHRK